MNNLNFLRLVSRAHISSINHHNYARILQQLAKKPMSTSVSVEKVNEKQVFLDSLPGIIDTLVNSPKISQLPEVGSWIKKLTQHTVIGGKNARGLMTTYAYEMMEKPENITEEKIKLARVLGWCIEFAQAYFCVLDDIMDESTMRRGAPCWYLMPNVGMGALNDSVLLSSSIMELLELYFAKTPYYTDLVKLFHETILYTCMGQHIDFTTAHHTKHDYSLFTIDRYDTIVRFKTSFYTFRLPALLGLTLVNDVDKRVFAGIDDISFLLGSLFQMQDDYIDCYGDEALTGKAGTDIQEGKCTWLSVHALKLCNEAQRQLFTKYYASKEPEHVAHIKKLYGDLHLQELYKQKEMEIYNDIVSRVKALPLNTAPNYFFKILGQTYKRNR